MKLSKKIMAHGVEIDEINLPEPTPEQVGRIGVPLLIFDQGAAVQMPVVYKYISELGQIPMSSVMQMKLSDIMAASLEIVAFFS